MCLIKVKGNARISKVAGAIAGCVRKTCHVEVVAVGPSAIANAVRAVAVARWYLADIEIVFVPIFRTVSGTRGERRAVVLLVACLANAHELTERGEMNEPETDRDFRGIETGDAAWN